MKNLDVSIVLGPPPGIDRPICLEQLKMLAERRSDVEIKAVEVNKRGKKEIVLVNPAGMDCGELFLIDGRLQIRNPNEATLSWMLTIADELGGELLIIPPRPIVIHAKHTCTLMTWRRVSA